MNIAISKPKLVKFGQYQKYLQQIDSNRWYSNSGPLLREFQARLAQLFGCEKEDGALVAASATSALSCVLYAIKIQNDFFNEKKYCLIPSWTFIATAVAAINAGFIPYFIDVDSETWMCNPKKLQEQIKAIDNIGAAIITAAFGRPVDIKSWQEFQKNTGIAVIIDGATGFDALLNCQEFFVNDTIPIVVSVHATKIFAISEGGVILSKNIEQNKLINRIINFGFGEERNVMNFGFNAKLSEYAAAIGLATLDNWPTIKNEWCKLTSVYKKHLDQKNIKNDLSDIYLKTTCNIIVDKDLAKLIADFKIKGIEARRWWGKGCAEFMPYQNYPKTKLDNTQKLVNSVIGIPFYLDQKEEEIIYIASQILEK